MGKVPHGERENMGISSTIASQTVSSKGTQGAQGGRTGICSELTSRQWLLGPLDIQLWRLDSRLASLWIWRACLVMLQARSDSEDRCQSQTPPGHLPVSAEVCVAL